MNNNDNSCESSQLDKSNIRQAIHLLLEVQEFLVILRATMGENKGFLVFKATFDFVRISTPGRVSGAGNIQG